MTCDHATPDGHVEGFPLGLGDKVADEHSNFLLLTHMDLHICWFWAEE